MPVNRIADLLTANYADHPDFTDAELVAPPEQQSLPPASPGDNCSECECVCEFLSGPAPDEIWIEHMAIIYGRPVTGEHFIFKFTDCSRAECLRVVERFAQNPELVFSQLDAARVSEAIREM